MIAKFRAISKKSFQIETNHFQIFARSWTNFSFNFNRMNSNIDFDFRLRLSSLHHPSLLSTSVSERHTPHSSTLSPLVNKTYLRRWGRRAGDLIGTNQKGISAVASPAPVLTAPPRQVTASATDDGAATTFIQQMCVSKDWAGLLKLESVATFRQLCAARDWEGALELESKMSAIDKTFEKDDPSYAGMMYFNLGNAHVEMGREGGH